MTQWVVRGETDRGIPVSFGPFRGPLTMLVLLRLLGRREVTGLWLEEVPTGTSRTALDAALGRASPSVAPGPPRGL